jgi:hypothetical protein
VISSNRTSQPQLASREEGERSDALFIEVKDNASLDPDYLCIIAGKNGRGLPQSPFFSNRNLA